VSLQSEEQLLRKQVTTYHLWLTREPNQLEDSIGLDAMKRDELRESSPDIAPIWAWSRHSLE
jgi:hypothetical protein